MLFRCGFCGRPVGKGEALPGDWRTCARCQNGLRRAGLLNCVNTRQVERQIRQQLRRPSRSSW